MSLQDFISIKKTLSIILFFFLLSYSVKAVEGPDTVKTGVYINSLHDINFHEKEYTLRFWIWMLYNKDKDIDFTKQIDIPNAKDVAPPEILQDSSGEKTWLLMKMKCVMKQKWQVHDYPFDRQILKLGVENTQLDVNDLVFDVDTAGSRYAEDLNVEDWTVENFELKSGVTNYNTAFGDPTTTEQFSQYGKFEIMFELKRNAWGLFLKIFIGMYMAFLIAIATFTIAPNEVDPRFGLPVGGLFAAVGNKYIIDSLLPESSGFTLVDTLHTFTYIAIFFTIIVASVSLIYWNRDEKERARKVNRLGAIAIISAYILLNTIWVGLAIMN